jgi:hypothetical protein
MTRKLNWIRWTICCWSPFGSSGTWGTAAVSQLGEVARRLRAELPQRGYVAVEYIESIGGKAPTSRVCAFAGEHGLMMAHRLPPDGVDICDPLNDAIIDGPVKTFATQELAEDELRGENFQCISEDDDGAAWITHEGRVAYIQKCLPLDQVEVGYYYTEARS